MGEQLTLGVVLFEEFETLDVMGPVEMFGMHQETFKIVTVAENSGPVRSTHGPATIADYAFSDGTNYDLLLVPGGPGTRREVDNKPLLEWLEETSQHVRYLTSVCTGSALLARAGILDGRNATSNKMSFEWVSEFGPQVHWVRQARWVEDGNIFTSSGVSAGMDMSLALISQILGEKAAKDAALWAEYSWHTDASNDPFAKAWGLV